MKQLLVLGMLALAGCSATPTSIVQRPTSNRPAMAELAPASNGAIYQSASYRPMFEDRRARHIGDTLTIAIVEKTAAVKAGASSGNKSGSVSFSTPGLAQGRLGGELTDSLLQTCNVAVRNHDPRVCFEDSPSPLAFSAK